MGKENLGDATKFLEEPGSRGFLAAFLARLHHLESTSSDSSLPTISSLSSPGRANKSQQENVLDGELDVHVASEALNKVRVLREMHLRKVKAAQVGLHVLLLLRSFLVEHGFQNLLGDPDRSSSGNRANESATLEYLRLCMSGRLLGRQRRFAEEAIK